MSDHPFGYSLEEMDVEAFFNMRDWLQKVCEAQGAKMVGGGVGMGQADIDIELDGCHYNISIKPLPNSSGVRNSNASSPGGSALSRRLPE